MNAILDYSKANRDSHEEWTFGLLKLVHSTPVSELKRCKITHKLLFFACGIQVVEFYVDGRYLTDVRASILMYPQAFKEANPKSQSTWYKLLNASKRTNI